MDFNFDVKIFGTPTGFEVYNGTEQDANYFQIFDRSSEETVKMIIVRHKDKISCNYLRYGFFTSQGRDGGKFGLSVVFHNGFCYAFKELYELFEAVYNTFAQHAILFKDNKFNISNFSDDKATYELQQAEVFVYNYVSKNFAVHFRPISSLDPNFSKDKIYHLSTNANNESIADAVNKYYMVSISPKCDNDNSVNGKNGTNNGCECKTDTSLIEKMMLVEKRGELVGKSEEVKNRVIIFQNKYISCLGKKQDIYSLFDEYTSIKNELSLLSIEIGNYIKQKIAPDLSDAQNKTKKKEDDLEIKKKEIDDLIKSLNYDQSFGGKSDSNKLGKLITAVSFFIRKNKTKVVALCVVILLVAGGCFMVVHFWPKETSDNGGDLHVEEPVGKQPSSIINIDSLSSSALEKFMAKDYVGAYKDYKTAGKAEEAKECQEKFKEICLSTAKAKPDEKTAQIYFANKMNRVDYIVTKHDRQQITSYFKTSSGGNGISPQEPAKDIKGKIQLLGDGVNTDNTVVWEKNFTLHFECSENCNSFKDSDIKWKRDDVDLGSGNDFSNKVNGLNTSYTYTCYVRDRKVATATVKCASRERY